MYIRKIFFNFFNKRGVKSSTSLYIKALPLTVQFKTFWLSFLISMTRMTVLRNC
jgi:hypothetical protein